MIRPTLDEQFVQAEGEDLDRMVEKEMQEHAEWEKKNTAFDKKYLDEPYDHCSECPFNYYGEEYLGNGYGRTTCKVAGKYQRLPREENPGALGLCVKIGGWGC